MGDASEDPSAIAQRLIDILKPHTPFADAIVRRQAERCGLAVHELVHDDLEKVLPLVIAAASTFVDPTVIHRLKALYVPRAK